ncbi:protein suppressor of hairy wing-like isoform X2 [Coccinella septempunctata]|uniref:protein suppressor of hairy wing-like isoform X2 n=1 Tax=Coccinella septempunctata TaxID=41139 RepID=UPI001D07FE24|nr:protein suppressor of hairy wing-like isoform X2 [Coccinella septempunctata]
MFSTAIMDFGIKTEEVKDDEVLLFSQLDQFRPNVSNSFSTLQESSDDSASLVFPETFNTSDFGGLLNDNGFTNTFCKPEAAKMFCKPESIKMESNPHFVKYKVLDGKHVKIWSCGICGKEFGHQYTLMRHLPTHTDERKFQCNTCGKAFRQMSTLSQHRAIHSAERPFICGVCQKTFNRVSTLISHRKTHTGLKPHRCHLCNKAFHQKGNLRNHIFTHTNERPYKCDICEKGFNQMSNLMCHKLKAHQRADKPKYVCRICGLDFPKRIGLRNHEQHQHGLNQNFFNAPSPSQPEKMKYSNAIIVDPIKTDAMRLAMQSNQTPFALLRPLTGIPVLVRVLPAGDKQMLIPATADDLKKHGQISIIPKVNPDAESLNADIGDKENGKPGTSSFGSTVQIKIPVVATVIQQSGRDGLSMSIVSPGPNGEVVNKQECTSTENNSFVFTSTLTASQIPQETVDITNNKNCQNIYDSAQLVENAEIEFLDQTGNMMTEEQFRNDYQLIPNALYQNNGIELSPHCIQTRSDDNFSSETCIAMRALEDIHSNVDDDSPHFLMPWNF